MVTPAARLALLIAVIAALGCGKSSGGSGSSAGPAASWVTDPAPTTATSIPPADTSAPDHVVGTGTAGSVTATALQAAITAGGIIAFDSGGAAVTLTLGAQLEIPQQKTVVIDGGGLVTLDGNHLTRLIHKNWQSSLTVQHLRFVNGDATGYDDSTNQSATSGAAINIDRWDGYLTVIDCVFDSCRAKQSGPDFGGGAIRAIGQRHTRISDCTFTNCSGSNGGAIVSLGSQLTVINSTFTGNHAAATSGGCGGAIYIDGLHLNADQHQLLIDGCDFSGNTGKVFGGALFCVAYQGSASRVVINATSFAGNSHDSAASGFAGAAYLQDADVTITGSTFSGNTSQTGVGALWMLSNQASRLANCTFSGNSSTTGTGAIDLSGLVFASNLTIADNTAGAWPAGIRVHATNEVWMKNCILADNLVTVSSVENTFNGWNTSLAVSDGGGNLQFPRQRGGTGVDDTLLTATVTVADPQLAPLADNGGATLTRMIPDAGAAMNHGTSVSAPLRDQRGLPRDATPDIGAVERQLPPAAPGAGG